MKRSFLIGKILKNMKNNHKKNERQNNYDTGQKSGQTFSSSLKENKKIIRNYLGNSQDVMFTQFKIHLENGEELPALLVAIDGLVDEEAKRNNVIEPLLSSPLKKDKVNVKIETIQEKLSVKNLTKEVNVEKVIYQILQSQAFLLVEGFSEGLLMSIEGFEIRAIEEPETEKTVRGNREGFIEATSVNLSLIRRQLSHPSLRFETVIVGNYSQTSVTVAYVKDIADPELVKRIMKRIKNIKLDILINSGEIEQLIEDHPYSIFPTIGNTERPDKAALLMMEGRVIILVNGDPVSLYIPFLFMESIKSIEDYTSRPYYSSFIRLIRFFAFIVSITLPGLYISAVNFNKSLIPTDMLVPIIIARESVPFPLALEILIMIIMFEMIREAGVRLPAQVGTAISIVGPLILGEVAVSSALVGAPTVIVVSISFIASFLITSLVDVTALLKIFIFIAASIFGSFGLTVVLLVVLTHMVSLTSLGVPYMAPFSPLYFRDWKDALVRFPIKFLKRRKKSIPHQRSKKYSSLPNMEDKR